MSKGIAPRKSNLKKRQDRDSSIGDRVSDDEANRRRSCYQLTHKEKERQLLAANDIRKDKDQLGILREILYKNKRDVNEVTQKSNKFISKNNTVCDGKNQSTRKTRPTSAKHVSSSGVIDWNQSEEDNLSANSADEEVVENEPVRLSRSNGKDDHQHPTIRSVSLYSQSRQPSNGIRAMNNGSFMSDASRNGTEVNMNTSPCQLKKLLDRLSSELNDLESMTGFKPNKNDLSSNTCSTALATALITLTGHVKQCTPNSKGKQEINNLKDQLSIVIKTQLDFQQKIEHQMVTLQTMMQTICQLVNNEIISNKKCETCISRIHRDQADAEIAEPRHNWSGNAQRSYMIPKDTSNAMDELLMFARRMNNAPPTDANLNRQLAHNPLTNRHSAYIETLEASKKLTRPALSMSTNEINGNDMSKQIQQCVNANQESHSSMISPFNMPLSYDMFEQGLPTDNSSVNTLRNEISRFGGTSNIVPYPSNNETILEKILQERLRLVQQMTELNKQHNMTQDELAHLEAKTIQQSRVT